MTHANKMHEALSKLPRLRVVEPHEARILGGEEARFDAWSNSVTGIGTSRDKTTYADYVPDRTLSDGEASAIYHGSDLAGRIVDIVPDEMYREGFAVDLGDAKLNTEIADQVEALGLVDKLADANRWGRLYGGGALLLGADDGRSAATPLMPERAKALSYVYVLDRRYLWPLTYYREAGHPKLGQAETYMVTSPSFQSDAPVSVVHESRLVLFGGATTGIRERESNSGWDYSILQRATKVLSDFDLGWGATSILLADGNQAVLNISGLADALAQAANGGQSAEAFLRERLRLIDMGRSVCRAVVLDAGDPDAKQPAEAFTRQNFPMTGIPDVLEKLMVRLSVTADVPCTRLFGISPAGLNATGESDVRGWYDRIRSNQNRKQSPKIRRVIRVMLQTKAVAQQPGAIKINFPSLWSESPLQAAQTRTAILTGDKIASDAGFLVAEEVGRHRFAPGGGGFEKEIAISDEGMAARDAALKSELAGLIPDENATDVPKVEIAPTDIAATLSVNEVRATSGFGPMLIEDGSEDPDGFLSVAAFKTKSAPAPGPGGFGGRGAGGAPGAPAEPAKAKSEKPVGPSGTAEDIDSETDGQTPPAGGGGPSRNPKAIERTDWDEDQPRDELGRFGEGDGSGSSGGGSDKGGGTKAARSHTVSAVHSVKSNPTAARNATRQAISAVIPQAKYAEGKATEGGEMRVGSPEEMGAIGGSQNSGASGWYQKSSNTIAIAADIVERAESGSFWIENSDRYEPLDKDSASYERTAQALYAVNVLHHEELHAMSRTAGTLGSERAGTLLEEVGTELAAIHVTTGSLKDEHRGPVRDAILSQSGYTPAIRSVQRIVEKHSDRKGDAALDAMRDAHIASALNGGKEYESPAEVVRSFVAALDVPEESRAVIAKKIGRLRL